MTKRQKYTQGDGNDKTKMPRTGDGYTARGRKPKTGELINMSDPRKGFGKPTRRQPKGWAILNVLPFGKKHKP